MNRPIKFRGLIKVSKTGLQYWTYYEIGSKPTLCGAEWLAENNEYTGLLDKNGKEIYEGDMLEETKRSYGKELKYKHEVLWADDYCGFEPFCIVDDFGRLAEPEDCEVVGNIYEKKEG